VRSDQQQIAGISGIDFVVRKVLAQSPDDGCDKVRFDFIDLYSLHQHAVVR
jgi:hypothetical protein